MATRKVSDENLLADLRELTENLGHSPTRQDLRDYGNYSYYQYWQRFGGLRAAVEAAGIEEWHPLVNCGGIDRADLLDELRRLTDELGRTPTVDDVREHGEYSHAAYHRHFGGLKNAFDAAGIEDTHSRVNCGPDGIDRDDLLDDLRRLGDEFGRPPKIKDVVAEGEFSQATYYNRFGSFTDALEAAGFPSAPGNRIPREELIDALQELADDLGRPPKAVEMAEQGRYGRGVYRHRFGSWAEAIAALERRGSGDDE